VNEHLLADAKRLNALSKAFVVTDEAQYQQAAQGLRHVKDFQTKVCAEMDPHIKRAHEAHKGLTTAKQQYLAPALEAEAVLKAAITGYLELQSKQWDDAVAAAIAEAKDAPDGAVIKVNAPAPKVQGISTSKRFTFEIVDPNDIALKFLQPNEVLIRKTVNALGMEAQALIGKGVRVKEVTTLRVGAK
jgi:hypothetical protein